MDEITELRGRIEALEQTVQTLNYRIHDLEKELLEDAQNS